MVDQNEMHGTYLIVSCTLHQEGTVIEFLTLVDYSATSEAFLDKDNA
jgi:hypothetical protein